MKTFPYERFIQWIAGPLAAAIGYGATTLVHANISHQTALNVATFVTTTAAVYLAHNKWLSNVPKWWDANQIQAITDNIPQSLPDHDETVVLDQKPETAATPDPPTDTAQLPAGTV